jgi:hypothetical protein
MNKLSSSWVIGSRIMCSENTAHQVNKVVRDDGVHYCILSLHLGSQYSYFGFFRVSLHFVLVNCCRQLAVLVDMHCLQYSNSETRKASVDFPNNHKS